MRIVILMGGVGSRFAAVGYQKPKTFLLVDGKPMLEHVVSMYPGAHEFIFVVNEQFVEMEELRSLVHKVPQARVVSIPPHKLGPVYSLSFVWDQLPQDEPVFVSYCDFSAGWSMGDFADAVSAGGWSGAIPAYTGFHPHLLHKKLYAGLLADTAGKMEKIQEKHSFTEDPQDSYHSAGNYYFSSAAEMKYYGEALMQSGNMLNGEYYVSMMYYQYLAEGKNILVYPLTHFLQWGTPEDLEEYEAWSLHIKGPTKGPTDIPESRKHLVQIPHQESSEAYAKSSQYWKDYFLSK